MKDHCGYLKALTGSLYNRIAISHEKFVPFIKKEREREREKADRTKSTEEINNVLHNNVKWKQVLTVNKTLHVNYIIERNMY